MNEQNQPTEQQVQTNIPGEWMKKELEEVEASKFDGEVLPSLQLEEGKVTEFEIDFSKEFEKWIAEDGTVKKIIPAMHGGVRKNFWLSTKNPCYRQIIERGAKGIRKFKILRTGMQKNTRYTLVKD